MGILLAAVEPVTSRDRRALVIGAGAIALGWVALRLVPTVLRAEARLEDLVAEQANALRAVKRAPAG